MILLPNRAFDAFLYDCDGTLADTMEPHSEAWVEQLAKHGVKIEKSLIYELAGMPATKTVEEINRRFGSSLNPQQLAEEKEKLFYDEYIHRVKPIQEVVDQFRASVGKVKVAVVSGGRKRVVHKTLEIIGISSLVQVVICAEDVQFGKPHPEPFLMAAAQLGVQPENCLVFEDAELGIQSAKAAKMEWVKV